MKPKLTTKPSNMVMPMRLNSPGRVCSTAIKIGSSAEVSAVALANPRWMTIKNAPSTASTPSELS
ncbi:hypothetical protein D3C80_2147100 [compost metagenome]